MGSSELNSIANVAIILSSINMYYLMGWLDIRTMEAAWERTRMEEAYLEVIRWYEAVVP